MPSGVTRGSLGVRYEPSSTATAHSGKLSSPCFIHQAADIIAVCQAVAAFGDVIHRQQRMRLSAAEGGIELDNSIASSSVGQALHHGDQLTAQAACDIRQIKEGLGILVLVLRKGFPKRNFTQVDSKYTQVKAALADVLIGLSDARPGWQLALAPFLLLVLARRLVKPVVECTTGFCHETPPGYWRIGRGLRTGRLEVLMRAFVAHSR